MRLRPARRWKAGAAGADWRDLNESFFPPIDWLLLGWLEVKVIWWMLLHIMGICSFSLKILVPKITKTWLCPQKLWYFPYHPFCWEMEAQGIYIIIYIYHNIYIYIYHNIYIYISMWSEITHPVSGQSRYDVFHQGLQPHLGQPIESGPVHQNSEHRSLTVGPHSC